MSLHAQKYHDIEPFLRWAGGKRWLSRDLAPLISIVLNNTGGTYYEPFLGSGAVFFGVNPEKALINDLNSELIDTYKWVKEDPFEIERIVKSWPVNKSTYYKIRASRFSGIEGAARFIYLNRTCYGGIHRTNKNGQFNTPYGGGSRNPDVLWRKRILEKCSDALRQSVELSCGDFEQVIDRAGHGDVIYCDPTYSDVKKGQFDRYGAIIFSWDDQVRLAEAVKKAANRGAVCIVSNGTFEGIRELYPKCLRVRRVRKKSIGRARVHGTDNEMLFILGQGCQKSFWENVGVVEDVRDELMRTTNEGFQKTEAV